MANKKTFVEQYAEVEEILRNCGNTELADFIKARAESVAKKNASRKAKANPDFEALQEDVLAYLKENAGKAFQIKDLIATAECCLGKTTSKISSVMSALIKADLVERTEVKGVALFSAK